MGDSNNDNNNNYNNYNNKYNYDSVIKKKNGSWMSVFSVWCMNEPASGTKTKFTPPPRQHIKTVSQSEHLKERASVVLQLSKEPTLTISFRSLAL